MIQSIVSLLAKLRIVSKTMVQDTCCTIAPYFKVQDEQLGAFKKLCEDFVSQTKTESKCLYYGFSFDGNYAHCREGYEDADALLFHLDNVKILLGKALEIAELVRLEIHGSKEELAKLYEPLSDLKPQYFVFEYGFRK